MKITKIEGLKKDLVIILRGFWARIDGIILPAISAFILTKHHPKDGLGKMANRQVPLACQIVCYFWQLHVVFSTP
jgi:hypothetical protein